MQATILCPKCKQIRLTVNRFGPNAEYAAHCPTCGPVSGFVIFGFRDFGSEPNDRQPEALVS
jgi:hypothetical protein